ncbi:MAG: hypothetical protein ACREPI_07990 [Candidatus Dormibacterales bacterium]
MPRRSSRATSTAGDILGQALEVGRGAIKEAQRRLPPDWRQQVETKVADAMRPVQAQVGNRARQSDLDALSRRVDLLQAEVDRLTRTGSPGGQAPPGASVRRAPAPRPTQAGSVEGALPRRRAAPRPPRSQ